MELRPRQENLILPHQRQSFAGHDKKTKQERYRHGKSPFAGHLILSGY